MLDFSQSSLSWATQIDRQSLGYNRASVRSRVDRVEQTQRDAIPQLLAMGLTVEQVAQALSLSVEEVQRLG